MTRTLADEHRATGATSGTTGSAAPEHSPSLLTAVAGFACFVVALQQTLVVPAIPQLPALLGVSAGLVSWAVTATLLTGAIATPIIATLSDIVGRRRMLVIAMIFVLIGSVLAPLGGVTLVIVGRALQGVGTALVPVAMATMRDGLPGHKIGPALALLSALLGVGGGIGIPLGGFIIGISNWQMLFWVSAVLAALSIAAIAAFIPKGSRAHGRSFDLPGAILLSIGLIALLLGVSQGNAWGWGSVKTIAAFVVGVVVLLVWGRVELKVAHPLVDLETSARRPLLLTNLASLTMGFLMFTNLLVTTSQLQGPASENGFGWSTAAAGLAMLPNAISMFLVAPLTASLARRVGPHVILGLGAIITAAGYLLRLIPVTSGVWLIVWATLIGIGVGIGYAALPMLIVEHSPGHQVGAANGVNALVRAVGTAISSAAVAAIGTTLAVMIDGHAVPSAGAIVVISLAGVVVSVITILFGLGAKEKAHAHGHTRTIEVTEAE